MEEPLPAQPIWRKPWFERIYRIGIVIKGIDGVLEFLAGMALLIAPHLLHATLVMLASEFGQHNARPFHFIAEYIGRVDAQLLQGGLFFLILFLITHGAVKIALVYCLLKRILKAYPIALGILVLFLFYQIYVAITEFSFLMIFFTVLDILIIWLVWNEYQELKTKAANVVK